MDTAVKTIFMKIDISIEKSAEEIKEIVVENFGKIDVLINDAHVYRQANFMDTTKEMFELSFQTGFGATTY